jgi:GAF domain-containing protein/HAMP domain-containing protein
MINTQDTKSEDYLEIKRATYRWAILYVLISFGVFLITFLLSSGSSDWQTTALKFTVTLALISTAAGTYALFQGNHKSGLSLVVAGILIDLLMVSFFVEGLGLLMLLAVIPLTVFTESATDRQKQPGQLMLMSIAIGVLAFVSDVYLGEASFRYMMPEGLQPFLVGFTVLLLFLNGFYIFTRFSTFSLRIKLVVSFVLVAIFSLGLLGFLNDRNTRNALRNEASESLFAAVQQTGDSILDFLNTTKSSVTNEAKLPVFGDYLKLSSLDRRGSPEEAQVLDTLEALLGKDEEYIASYALLDVNGVNLADTDLEDIGSDKSDRIYFQQVIESEEPYLSDMIISQRTGTASLYFSSPIIMNELVGVLRVRYDASILQDLLVRSNDLVGKDSFGVLFDDYFIHLAHGTAPETIFTTVMPLESELLESLKSARRLPDLPPEELFHNLPELELHLIAAQNSPDGLEFFEATDVATGERILQVVAVEFEDPPWLLVFFQPEDIFLAPAIAQTQLSVILIVVIAAVMVAVGVGLAQILSNPILELTSVAEKIAGGDITAQSDIPGTDEIATLSSTFNSMTSQMRDLVSSLEDQVAERTQDLEKRAIQLQAAAEIARDATAEPELGNLLNRAVNLTRSRFDLNYVGVYLMDVRKENVYLRAGTGDFGEKMLKKRQRIDIKSQAAVGAAARSGEPQIISAAHLAENPDQEGILPDTQSQLVLALRVGEEILGTIEFQSAEEDAFGENEIALLQTLADQLANATQKTSLRTEVEETLRELESAYGQFTRSAWQNMSQSESRSDGYRFDQRSVEKTSDHSKEAIQAWEQNKVVTVNGKSDGSSALAVPMKIRGEVIGVLNLQFDNNIVPSESQALIEELANRLGLVMENARLLETAQRRVEREQLLAEVTVRMRETLDIDEILKTAVQEIGEKFGINDAEIRLGVDSLPSIETAMLSSPEVDLETRDLHLEQPEQE